MLKDKYIKSLTQHEGRMGKVVFWAMIIAPIFMAVMGCLNLWQASRIGGYENYSLIDFARIWLEEIDVKRTYIHSGIFLKGLNTFNTALFQFVASMLMLITSYSYFFQRKRNAEVISILRKHNEA